MEIVEANWQRGIWYVCIRSFVLMFDAILGLLGMVGDIFIARNVGPNGSARVRVKKDGWRCLSWIDTFVCLLVCLFGAVGGHQT
jgi:hypothetical protein